MPRGLGEASDDPYLPPGERQELLRQLEANDDETEELRRGDSDEQRRQKLLVCLETGLSLRRRLYAESSPQVAAACQHLCEACNFAATRMLQADNLKGARELLKRAEQVAEKSDACRAITFNNLACFYRRTGKLRSAVGFLERALAIEEHSGNPEAAQTHLNICACLSQLQRHADALYHAQSALIRLYESLSPRLLAGDLSGSEEDLDEECLEQVTVLCIAYHNLAVEHEHLKNYVGALSAYCSGLRWADKFLPPSQQLIGIMRDSLEAVKAKLPKGCGALARADELSSWSAGGANSGQQRPATGSSRQGRSPRSARSEGEGSRLGRLLTPRGEGDHSPHGQDYDSSDNDRDRDRDRGREGDN